jgi:regulatory protein
MELRQKGIDKATMQYAFSEREVDREEEVGMSEEERARSIVERKMRQYSHLPPETVKRRLAGVLLRRGFPTDLVMRILKT